MADLMKRLTDKPNLLANIETIVKNNLESGEIPSDAKLVGIGIVDSEGIKLVGTVELLKNTTNRSLKIKAIFEHDWDGNDSIAGKVVFTSR
jgi:hypothetical protein